MQIFISCLSMLLINSFNNPTYIIYYIYWIIKKLEKLCRYLYNNICLDATHLNIYYYKIDILVINSFNIPIYIIYYFNALHQNNI